MSERPSNIKVWLLASRPKTLTACLAPVAVGTALAVDTGNWCPWLALAALFGAFFIQLGTNFYNDYADFKKGADTEERLGPARATQKGWLTANQVKWAANLSFLAAALIGGLLVVYGGWPIAFIGVTGIACGYAYTGGPYPLAYVGLGDVFVMLYFGFAAVCGTYYLQTGTVTPAVLWASWMVGAMATAILVVNNLRDRVTDAKASKNTLVVRFGAGFARFEWAFLVFGSFVILPLLVFQKLGDWGWTLPMLVLPLAIWEFKGICQRDGADLNPHLGGTARLGLLFSLLLAGGILL